MVEQREESDYVGDCRVPMKETGKILGLASKTEILEGEVDSNTVEVSESGVFDVSGTDENPNGDVDVASVKDTIGSVTKDNVSSCDVEKRDPFGEPEKSQRSSVDGEMFSAVEVRDEQEKESANNSGEYNTKMDVDYQQANEENVGLNDKHSQGEASEGSSETVLEVSSAVEVCREEKIAFGNPKEINGEAMEIDDPAEKHVEKDVKVVGALGDAGNESAGASVVARADRNDSNVVKEIDELKENIDMSTGLDGTIESADCSANPKSPSDDDATGEVEPLDHNALFDPSSDITNFIDFTGVSCWSGNIQDLTTETNISLKEDKRGIALVDCKATLKSADATVNAESHNNLNLGSEENQEEKNHECVVKKAVDQQDAMREEVDSAHEASSIESKEKRDIEMEENPNNSGYAENGIDSDLKTKGVKRKADVLSEDTLGEGRETVPLAKVSSFKIGAGIARAASQMAESPSVLKGSNFGDETLSVESCVSQLHCAATDPDKENVVSETAAGFFSDFRNSSASQEFTPEKVSTKIGRPSTSTAGGTEAFEFEERGDTYWTDRVIHNGGEEQTPPTEKENYQVVPAELKPAQVERTRRPYRRRHSQISSPFPPALDKPANFDGNAPAELIMNFSETDTIPPEKSLSKMFRHFGPIKDSQTEVDPAKNRARVVFRKGADAEVAYKSVGRFNIFGTKAVNYELRFTVTETFKVQPYVVSLGEEEETHCVPS